MIRGIIFDMDGVIIDSNRMHFNNWDDLLGRKYNVRITKDEFAEHLGENPKDFTNYFLTKYRIPADYNDFFKEINGNLRKFIPGLKLKPGLKEAVQALSKEYRLAIATGADREAAEYTVQRFRLQGLFSYIIGGSEVENAKPNPEIFLRAAKGLSAEPGECVVIEDSYNGLVAAKRAGMRCIIVKDEFTSHHDHSTADIILKSIRELTPQLVAGLEDKNGQRKKL